MTATKQADPGGIAATVSAEVKKHLSPLEGLLKQLSQPASAAGCSPVELLQKMTNGGTQPVILGSDGSSLPASIYQRRSKGIGMGPMLQDMVTLATPKNSMERQEVAKKRLFDDVEKGGYGLKAALAESSGGTGAYTIAPQFSQKLMQLAIEGAIVEPRASSMPMTGLTLQVPYLDQVTAQSGGRTAFLGGVVPTWTSEAATRAETEPTFKQMELKAWELSMYCVASNNLLADNAVGLDSLLTQLFGAAIPWYTEYAYLQGDAVGKPRGVINAPATIAVSRGTASRVRYVDVVTMQSRLLMESWQNAVWVAHQSIIPDLLQMHDSSGNQTGFGAGRSLFVSVDQGASKEPEWRILGRQVLFTEKVPSLGNRGDLGLYDFSKYLLGKRQEIEIAVSPHVNFLNNQMVWRVIWRGDGQPWLSGPITLADGTFTVSPFVTLS